MDRFTIHISGTATCNTCGVFIEDVENQKIHDSWHKDTEFRTHMIQDRLQACENRLPEEELDNARAERAALRESMQRQMDLIRYARHFLHDEGLISDEEYAEIVQDNEGGKRKERLEAYDKAIADAKAHERRCDAEVRDRALEEVLHIASLSSHRSGVADLIKNLSKLRDSK